MLAFQCLQLTAAVALVVTNPKHAPKPTTHATTTARLDQHPLQDREDPEWIPFERVDPTLETIPFARCAPKCPSYLLKNLQCNRGCNTKECNFDGGDCVSTSEARPRRAGDGDEYDYDYEYDDAYKHFFNEQVCNHIGNLRAGGQACFDTCDMFFTLGYGGYDDDRRSRREGHVESGPNCEEHDIVIGENGWAKASGMMWGEDAEFHHIFGSGQGDQSYEEILDNSHVACLNHCKRNDGYEESESVTASTSARPSGECSPGCPLAWEGDGMCDSPCDTRECGYDGGDCIVDNTVSCAGRTRRDRGSGAQRHFNTQLQRILTWNKKNAAGPEHGTTSTTETMVRTSAEAQARASDASNANDSTDGVALVTRVANRESSGNSPTRKRRQLLFLGDDDDVCSGCFIILF